MYKTERDRCPRSFSLTVSLTSTDNIQRSLDVTFNEIDKKTVHLIDDKKQLATEVRHKAHQQNRFLYFR